MLSQDEQEGPQEASGEEGPQADLPSLTPSLLNTSASVNVAAVPWKDLKGKAHVKKLTFPGVAHEARIWLL